MNENDLIIAEDDLHPVSPTLAKLGKTLGSRPDEGDIDTFRLRLRIGRRPFAVPLQGINRSMKRKASNQYSTLLSSLEYWMIVYSIGIQDEGDWRNVVRFGLKVRLPDQEMIRVISVFPETQMLRLGKGKAQWKGTVGVSGALDATLQPMDFGENPALSSMLNPLISTGMSAAVDTRADAALGLSFDVLSPLVVATGENDIVSAWSFTQAPDNLLVGDQLVGHVVSLPRPSAGSLSLEAELFADLGVLSIFTSRWKSEVIKLSVPLVPK